MSTADSDQTAVAESETVALDGSTYEVLRGRISTQGSALRQRLEQLNESRKDVFGSIETVLDHTERITTEHNCTPRDIVAVGEKLLFGYNIHFGLRSETHLEDVFAVYTFSDGLFHAEPLNLINDDNFEKDFKDVYRYYKNATFAKFFVQNTYLFMVFRVGKSSSDIKTFKWQMNAEGLTYLDNRSDHEVRFPSQYEFEWQRTHRNLHQDGTHPHISIDDRVFVETVGGDLTIKIEDNTNSGEGIFSEPVDDPDQTLDDAEIFYAIVGNIVFLKIRPYQENSFRYIVYNEKQQKAQRLDAIEHACVLLPDDHGVIFSNGYYLQDGQHKLFENDLSNMLFERRIPSPNGEDYLYVFYNRESGIYILLQYNMIARKVAVPIICHGFALQADGSLLCFKDHHNPQKHHPVQVWNTPYVSEEFVPEAHTDSFLYKIGNRDIVRGMAECNEVLNLIDKEDNYTNLYVDLAKKTNDILDSYFWINSEQAFSLNEPLAEIHNTATSAVDEFEKVVRVRGNTRSQMSAVEEETREIVSAIGRKRFDNISEFVDSLSKLRSVRGEIISLRDLRYVDETLVDDMEKQAVEELDKLAKRCVGFLLRDEALKPYVTRVESQAASIDSISKVVDAKKLEDEVDSGAQELELLIEIVSNLKIDDATHRTAIIDRISAIFSTINQTRAALKNKTQSLFSAEGIAEFNSQIKLLNQGVANYLDVCDTPQQCEDYLTRVMVQLEELEGRFAEFDEFVVQLVEKRDEVYNTFETRRLQLVESRNKRCQSLADAADRILKGVKSRVGRLESVDDIHGYFASDLMIDKARNIVDQLAELEDTVRVDDIQTRLKTIQEEAIRQLKDRQDLYSGDGQIIQLGNHQFTVTSQALDLTTVFRDGQFYLHLTGTRFFEELEHPDLLAAKPVWEQEVLSENDNVYRGEYLVYQIFKSSLSISNESEGKKSWHELAALGEEELAQYVAEFAGPRYDESYTKGVHDHDAALILRQLLNLHQQIGLLQYSSTARTLARYFWLQHTSTKVGNILAAQVAGAATIEGTFSKANVREHYVQKLAEILEQLNTEYPLFDESLIPEAARYLYVELAEGGDFRVSQQAVRITNAFRQHLESTQKKEAWLPALKSLSKMPEAAYILARDWIRSYLASSDAKGNQMLPSSAIDYVDEAALLLTQPPKSNAHVISAETESVVEQCIGNHPVLENGSYQLNYNHFFSKLTRFEQHTVPLYQRFVDAKKNAVERGREEIRLDEFRPRVLTSFVRNRLLDTVYLPLIGDNLAKQMGAAGDQKRTDRMGLLLLVSPPGYGKTTVMEYVANRLGIVFMKINGPAIGHRVTSLDPAEAANAAAREEVEKLNLALEMGDNVMIYLDDIQHCNPEFLQKFISLCDAQRRIEGVYKGKTRTYDLRGRKVAVVMAGNPYTESGERFQIPDMLSNRADIYNLGDIIGDNANVFEMSYLENCMTSNPTLSKVAHRNPEDIHALIKLAENVSSESVDLQGKYSGEEVEELVSTMRKLLHVRDVVLSVNREYIRSAAQSADYRTEPPFKLQGSYRNMNRIAEKVLPIINDKELHTLIASSYENDAQTLTSDAEANLLKFKELTGQLSDVDKQRWDEIKKAFQRNVKMRGVKAEDQAGQLILQVSTIGEELESIQNVIAASLEKMTTDKDDDSVSSKQVEQLCSGLDGIQKAVLSQMESLTSAQNPSGNELANSLHSILKEMKEAAPPASSSGMPLSDRVTVVNKIPSTLFKVLRSQFDLMEGWLQPLLSATQNQSAELKELQERLKTCLDSYTVLLGRMDKSNKVKEEE